MNIGKIDKVLKEVLKEITPTKQETGTAKKKAAGIVEKLNKSLKGINAKATIQGSFRKNTQLRNSFDIDIFVHFNKGKYQSKDKLMSDILEKNTKKLFRKTDRLHGSRDYFQAKEPPFMFEIVPILHISKAEEAKNITDVSPLHAKWVARKVKGKESDIRLAKSFLTAQGIYGAESYVRGFSGYACEILTIHYNSFPNFMSAASKWREKEVIDPEKAYKNTDPLLFLNKSKTASPLVVIDPVQPTRNVTAALSDDAYRTLIKSSKKFLQKPSKDFFVKKVKSKEDLKKLKRNEASLLLIELTPHENKHDVTGAAMLRNYNILKKELAYNLFKVKKSGWFWEKGEKGALWYLISKKLPPRYELREGPKKNMEAHAARFRRKHKNAFTMRGRIHAKVERKFKTPSQLASHVLKQKNFREKIKRVRAEWH